MKKMDILDYINNLRTNRGTLSDKEIDGVHKLFRSGYCYIFAETLKRLYPGGQIMLCFPKSHVVYQYKKRLYDIEGEIDPSKVDYVFIPFTADIFGKTLYDKLRKSFQHVTDEYPVKMEELIQIYVNYLYDEEKFVEIIDEIYKRQYTKSGFISLIRCTEKCFDERTQHDISEYKDLYPTILINPIQDMILYNFYHSLLIRFNEKMADIKEYALWESSVNVAWTDKITVYIGVILNSYVQKYRQELKI